MVPQVIYRHPSGCSSERVYTVRFLIEEVFGLGAVLFEEHEETIQSFSLRGEEGIIQLPDSFFAMASSSWLSSQSLPDEPLQKLTDGTVVLFGDELSKHLAERSKEIWFAVDVVGSLFFLMSRYEEVVCNLSDEHDRFPPEASVLWREKLLEKAVGNEYMEALWSSFVSLWPGLKRRPREFRVVPSHDIDWPSEFWGVSPKKKVRASLQSLKNDGLRNQFERNLQRWFYPRRGWSLDPFDSINWILEESEKQGAKSAFYYIPKKTDPRDTAMSLTEPQVENQWQTIASRGHELGVHPGYQTYSSETEMRKSVEAFRGQMDKLKVSQSRLGSRQHFLRWKSTKTARILADCKIDYDSSLGFAQFAGFRTGLCYEFPLYDLESRKELSLREKPLLVMDCTLMDRRYMNLGTTSEAVEHASKIKEECRRFSGDFTLLWHNTRLLRADERSLYTTILAS